MGLPSNVNGVITHVRGRTSCHSFHVFSSSHPHGPCDNSHLFIVNGDRQLRLPLTVSTSRSRKQHRKEREIEHEEEGRR